jgi:hypothetical protein
MTAVHFALQDGFADDEVIVRVNGKEVVRQSNVRSQDPVIPFAAAKDVSIDQSSGTVAVDVPTRRMSQSFTVDFKEYPYLGIAIAGNAITLRKSGRPFEYM